MEKVARGKWLCEAPPAFDGDSGDAERQVLEMELDEFQEAAAEASERAKAESDKFWKKWAEEVDEAGASKEHAFTKVRHRWVPTTVRIDDEKPSAAPSAILEAETRKWASGWDEDGESESEDEECWRAALEKAAVEQPKLGETSAEQVERAANSFCGDTASDMSGLHVRHFGLIQRLERCVVARLLLLVEFLAKLPSQVCRLLVPLLTKPTGGHRPITVFLLIYRIWGTVR